MDTYREKIIMSYLYMQSTRDGLLDNIINVAMSGEYKSISETFSLGDSYEFDLLQFRDTDDISLNKLIDVYDEMDAAMDTIINLNVITDEEIEEVEKDWMDLMAREIMEDVAGDELLEDLDFEDEEIWEELNFDDLEKPSQNGEDLDWEEDINDTPPE